MACDYFLDALADPDLALKIREKQPADLDSALWLALQLEVRAVNMARLHAAKEHKKTEPRRVWEISKPKMEATIEALQKEVEEQRRKFAVLENKLLARNNPRGEQTKSIQSVKQTESVQSATRFRLSATRR